MLKSNLMRNPRMNGFVLLGMASGLSERISQGFSLPILLFLLIRQSVQHSLRFYILFYFNSSILG